MLTQQFRTAVYQSILKLGDAIMDLVDALTVAGHVDSPVALSEEAPFRRKFGSIFDNLLHGEFNFDLLLRALHEFQPSDGEKIAGYEGFGWIAPQCTPRSGDPGRSRLA